LVTINQEGILTTSSTRSAATGSRSRKGRRRSSKPDGTGKYSLVGRVQIERWVPAK
jgi:hypothetical protein